MLQLLVLQVPSLQAALRRVTAQIGVLAGDGSMGASSGDSAAASDQVSLAATAAAVLSLLLPSWLTLLDWLHSSPIRQLHHSARRWCLSRAESLLS